MKSEAAKLLGMSQPAISLYQAKLRGTALPLGGDPEISALVMKHADYLVKGAAVQEETLLSFCGICKTLRAKGYLCEIQKAFDPSVSIDTCRFCQTANHCP